MLSLISDNAQFIYLLNYQIHKYYIIFAFVVVFFLNENDFPMHYHIKVHYLISNFYFFHHTNEVPFHSYSIILDISVKSITIYNYYPTVIKILIHCL